jgi:hypothetical protein
MMAPINMGKNSIIVLQTQPYPNEFSLFILSPFASTRLFVAAVSEVHG